MTQIRRIIIQRVVRGAVTVQGNVVGKIGRGLVVLVGIQKDDSAKDAEYLFANCL